MHPATWFFYGLVVFFLGLMSVASGGAIVLAQFLSREASGAGSLQPLLTGAVLAATALFVVGGVAALSRPARGDS